MKKINKYLKLIISIIVPLIVGSIGSFATKTSVKTWYLTLNKPFFNPPNWLFALVWSLLFVLMGISFYLIWRKSEITEVNSMVYIVYFVQLLFNLLWSIFFFGLRNPFLGLVDIVVLLGLIIYNFLLFYNISKVSFASILNLTIVFLNK